MDMDMDMDMDMVLQFTQQRSLLSACSLVEIKSNLELPSEPVGYAPRISVHLADGSSQCFAQRVVNVHHHVTELDESLGGSVGRCLAEAGLQAACRAGRVAPPSPDLPED